MKKFYNAGDRIRDSFYFNLVGGADIHCLSKWNLEAPSKEFFEVPSILRLTNDSEVAVTFPKDVIERFWKRGVVMIDPKSPFCDDPTKPIARDEAQAKEKAEALWDAYVDDAVTNWIDQCQQVRAVGGIMRAASGFTKRALELRNVEDPAVLMRRPAQQTVQPTPASNSEVELLKQQLARMEQQLSMMSGEKVREKAAEANRRQLEVEEALNTEPVPASKLRK